MQHTSEFRGARVRQGRLRRGIGGLTVFVVLAAAAAVPGSASATRQAWFMRSATATATVHSAVVNPPTCADANPPDKTVIAGDYSTSMRGNVGNNLYAQYNGFFGPGNAAPLYFSSAVTSTSRETYRDIVRGRDAQGNETCQVVDRQCQQTFPVVQRQMVTNINPVEFTFGRLTKSVLVDFSSIMYRLYFKSCVGFGYGGALEPFFFPKVKPHYPIARFRANTQHFRVNLSRPFKGQITTGTAAPFITAQLGYVGEITTHKSTVHFDCQDHNRNSGFVCNHSTQGR